MVTWISQQNNGRDRLVQSVKICTKVHFDILINVIRRGAQKFETGKNLCANYSERNVYLFVNNATASKGAQEAESHDTEQNTKSIE